MIDIFIWLCILLSAICVQDLWGGRGKEKTTFMLREEPRL